MKVSNNNFYVVAGWMINELGLKGTTLNVFAIIYGFTQDQESEFTGSRQYLCDFTGATKPTVDKALNELIELGLIEKTTTTRNGVKFNSYRTLKNFTTSKETLLGGGKETLLPDGKETLHNNIELNNIDKNNIDKESKEKLDLFETFWEIYPKKVAKKEALKSFSRIKNLDKEYDNIIKGLKAWKKTKQWNQIQYIPYPSTWLNQERWKDLKDGKIGEEVVDTDEWYKNYYDLPKETKAESDKEIEDWYLKNYGEKVTVKNGKIIN